MVTIKFKGPPVWRLSFFLVLCKVGNLYKSSAAHVEVQTPLDALVGSRCVFLPGRRAPWTFWPVVGTERSGCGSAAPSQTRGSAASHTPPSSPRHPPEREEQWMTGIFQSTCTCIRCQVHRTRTQRLIHARWTRRFCRTGSTLWNNNHMERRHFAGEYNIKGISHGGWCGGSQY